MGFNSTKAMYFTSATIEIAFFLVKKIQRKCSFWFPKKGKKSFKTTPNTCKKNGN